MVVVGVVPVTILEDFRALKSSNLEDFSPSHLKSPKFEASRVLKPSARLKSLNLKLGMVTMFAFLTLTE